MGSGQNGHTDAVDILLQGRFDNLLRALPQTGINNFHTGITKSPRHDKSPAVVTIESRFGNEYSKWRFGRLLRHSLCYIARRYFPPTS